MPTLDQPRYYALRASEYEKVYHIPEEQPDLVNLYKQLPAIFIDRKVLEIACGTGIWTQIMAETAHSVLATDINEPMLHIARQKQYPRQNVVFEIGDMFDLQVRGAFDALFGGFIWSHVPLEKLENWLDNLHRLLEPGSVVVFVDSCFVAGKSTPIFKTDEQGNTVQKRKLEDGSEYLVVKNFPNAGDFERLMKGRCESFRVTWLEYFWALEYVLGANNRLKSKGF